MQEKQNHITDDIFGQLPEIEPGQQWMDGLNAKIHASQKRPQFAYYTQGATLIAVAVLVNALILLSNIKTKPEKDNHYQQIYQELLIVPTNSGSNG